MQRTLRKRKREDDQEKNLGKGKNGQETHANMSRVSFQKLLSFHHREKRLIFAGQLVT